MGSESQLFSKFLRIYFQQYIAIYCKSHVIARVYTGFVVTLGTPLHGWPVNCDLRVIIHIQAPIGLIAASKSGRLRKLHSGP